MIDEESATDEEDEDEMIGDEEEDEDEVADDDCLHMRSSIVFGGFDITSRTLLAADQSLTVTDWH